MNVLLSPILLDLVAARPVVVDDTVAEDSAWLRFKR